MNSTQSLQKNAARTLLPVRVMWMLGGALLAASLAAGAGLLARQAPNASAQPTPAHAQTAAPAAALPAAKAPEPQRVAAARPAPAAPAVCAACGTVESVRAVKRKGEAQGVGAVAGGVLGAVVGNQMGKGDGRKAMTVIGAVGGGVAGHEVEKRARSTTVHVVQVRMDDGTRRTLEVAKAPKAGERVRVEGGTLRPNANG
jgi:outer membrane lipoprotein SlyB